MRGFNAIAQPVDDRRRELLLRVRRRAQAARRGEVLRQERSTAGQDDGVFQGVAQFADVSHPRLIGQELHRRRQKRQDARVEAHEKMLCQRHDVVAPLAQRRQVNLEDVQAKKQIVAKRPLGDLALQVLMRRRQYPDAQGVRLIAADGRHLVVFQDAQELHLHRHRDVGQFVEEDGAAVRQRQQARLRLCRARERAFDVAKEFALDEIRIERGDVNREEGPLAPRAVAMHGAGDQLLARAALAGDEHARLARRHQRDPLEHHLHGGTGADHLFRRLDAFLRRLTRRLLKRPALEGAGDGVERLIEIKRLGEIVERAPFDRPHRGRKIAERRHDNDRRIARQLFELGERRQSVEARQTHVEHDGVGRLLLGQTKRFLRRRNDGDLMPELRERLLERPADGFLVIDNQEVAHALSP